MNEDIIQMFKCRQCGTHTYIKEINPLGICKDCIEGKNDDVNR